MHANSSSWNCAEMREMIFVVSLSIGKASKSEMQQKSICSIKIRLKWLGKMNGISLSASRLAIQCGSRINFFSFSSPHFSRSLFTFNFWDAQFFRNEMKKCSSGQRKSSKQTHRAHREEMAWSGNTWRENIIEGEDKTRKATPRRANSQCQRSKFLLLFSG